MVGSLVRRNAAVAVIGAFVAMTTACNRDSVTGAEDRPGTSHEALTLPTGFIEESVGGTWDQAVGLTFAENGRLFVWEKSGHVWEMDADGTKHEEPFLDLEDEVGNWRDHGMLGFALHPNFVNNGYVYAMYVVDYHHLSKFGTPQYSAATDEYFHDTVARLVRYQAKAADGFTTIDPASRTVLLGSTFNDGCPMISQSHGVGSLVFGQDGTLLISCGDSASYDRADYGGPDGLSSNTGLADGIIRSAEDVGAFRAQIIDSHAGKVLRIDALTGEGLPSNPFFDASHPKAPRSKVWTLGLRNPYRMTLRPESGSHSPEEGKPGTLYIGDVGWNAMEELDIVKGPAQNLGWPLFEGLITQPDYNTTPLANRDAPNPLFGTTPSGGSPCTIEFFRFGDLLKQDAQTAPSFKNPCNQAVAIPSSVPTFVHARPALSWRHFADDARVPIYDASGNAAGELVGVNVTGQQFQGTCSIGGVWYEGDDFPSQYKNTYFHAEYGSGWIKNFVFDENDKLVSVRNFAPSSSAPMVGLATHPTQGSLYYIAYENIVKRIRYVASGNQPPTAIVSATPSNGPSPLPVQLSSSGSHDPELGPLTYNWSFGDGSPPSNLANPTHTFSASGTAAFVVSLTVTDVGGLSNTSTTTVVLNSSPPRLTFVSPLDGDLFTPGPKLVSIAPEDSEQPIEQLQCSVKTILHHNQHVHPEAPVSGCMQTIELSSLPCSQDVYFYEISATVSDGTGLQTSKSVFSYPDCAPLDLSPSGTTEPKTVTYSWQAVLGADQYELELSDSVASPRFTLPLALTDITCEHNRCQKTLSQGLADGPVSFRVRSHNPHQGWRGWSAPATFIESSNDGPVVSTGANFTATVGQVVQLAGVVTDDGLPASTLTSAWSQVNGPATVSFPQGDQSSPQAHVVFPAAGIYTLRLSATDGVFTTTADVTATVTGENAVCERHTLAFAGSSWVSIPEISLAADFTIEAWAKLDAGIDNQDALVGPKPGSPDHADLNFWDAKLRVYTGMNDPIVANTTTVAGTWTHYALTRSNGTLRLYVNGTLDATGTWNGTFRLGAIGHGNAGYLQGQLDEVRIWNSARTATEINTWYGKKVAPQSAGLIAYYDFNEQLASQSVFNKVGSASSATLGADAASAADDPSRSAPTAPVEATNDCAGTSTNYPPTANAGPDSTATVGAVLAIAGTVADDGLPSGTITAQWTLVSGPGAPTFVAGEQSMAATHVTFPTAGSYVLRLTASDGALTSFDDVTVTAQDPSAPTPGCSSDALSFDGVNDWVNVPDFSLTGDFTIESWVKLAPGIDNKDGIVGESIFGPDLNFYAGMLRLYTGGGDAIVATTAATANAWTHYAVTRQAGALKLYINGALNAQGNWGGTFPVQALARSAAGFLQGQLEEVRIWSVARSATDISGAYQQKLPATTSGLLAYYAFNEGGSSQNVVNAVGAGSGATLGANASVGTDDPARVASTAPMSFASECGPAVNQAPQVSAGPDRNATVGVTLAIAGTATDDGLPTGSTLGVAWTVVSGPGTPTFAAGEQSLTSTHVTFSVAGSYVLRLSATDGTLTSTDDVTVNAQEVVNQAPQVSAGADKNATVGVALAIAGTATDDGLPSGSTLSVGWTLVSGPGTPTFAAGEQSQASTHVTFPVAGSYVLRLSASDGALTTADDVAVSVQNPSVPTPGCSSDALSFDGVNDWVNVPDFSLTGDFTIESWVKLAPGIDNKDGIVGESIFGPDLNFYAGMLRLYTGGGDAVVATTAATANTWTHYAVTRQAGALKLYVNGALNAQGNWGGTFPVQGLGRAAAGFLQGQLEEVRIWSVARSATDISGSYQQKVPTTTSGLLAYYAFNEGGSSQNVVNSVGDVTGATLGASASAGTDDPARVASTAPMSFASECGPPVNQAPQVSAGPDRNATVGVTLAIAGTATDDGLPTPAALDVGWTLVSGPGTPSWASGEQNLAATHITFPVAGSYVLRLTATDGALTTTDDVTISAQELVNQAPQVSAGPDLDATISVALAIAGTATDDGLPTPTTLDVGWTLVSGPGTPTWASGEQNLAATHVTLPVVGTYVLRLTATDGALTTTDDVTITAHEPSSCPSETLSFDGTDDWVKVPEISLSGDFTIETWVKLAPGIDNHDGIIGQDSIFWPDLNFYAGQLRLYVGGMDAVVANTPATPNVWTHYAVTRQAGAMKLYVNGVLDAQGSWSGTLPIRAIGRAAAGYLQGQLDELRVWSTARTASQIAGAYQQKVPTTSSGLLAYYAFNEGSGSQSVINSVGAATGATLGVSASVGTDDPARVASTVPMSFVNDCSP